MGLATRIAGAEVNNRKARRLRRCRSLRDSVYWNEVLRDDKRSSALTSYCLTGGNDLDRISMLSSMITTHQDLYPDVPVLVMTESNSHAEQIINELQAQGIQVRRMADNGIAYDYGYGFHADEMIAVLTQLAGDNGELAAYISAFVNAVAAQGQPVCIASMRDLCRAVGDRPELLANIPGISPAESRFLHDFTGCFWKLTAMLNNMQQLPAYDDERTDGVNFLTIAASGIRGVSILVMPRCSKARNALLAAEVNLIREQEYNMALVLDDVKLPKEDPLRKAVDDLVDRGGNHSLVCLCWQNALVQYEADEPHKGIQAWCIFPDGLTRKNLDALLCVFSSFEKHEVNHSGGQKRREKNWTISVRDRQRIKSEDLIGKQAVLSAKDVSYVVGHIEFGC